MNDAEALGLLALARALLQARRAASVESFLTGWPGDSAPRPVAPVDVPATRWLERLRDLAPAFSAPFVAALAAAAPGLAWRRSYSVERVGEEFYRNYGWTELAGLTGPTPSRHLACGVLVLGPELLYPAHRHEAEELYVPLAGTAEWRQGGGAWQARAPGSVISHAGEEPHAMRTGRDPLLALYLWRGANLAQHSRLD